MPQVSFPQHHLPAGSQVLHKDNAKDKPEEADNWVLCFCWKVFIPWGKNLLTRSLMGGGGIMNSKAKGK